MAISNTKAVFQRDIQKVWEVVTNVANYPRWRSDLSRTEILKKSVCGIHQNRL